MLFSSLRMSFLHRTILSVVLAHRLCLKLESRMMFRVQELTIRDDWTHLKLFPFLLLPLTILYHPRIIHSPRQS